MGSCRNGTNLSVFIGGQGRFETSQICCASSLWVGHRRHRRCYALSAVASEVTRMIYLVKWKNHGHRKKKAPVQCFMFKRSAIDVVAECLIDG